MAATEGTMTAIFFIHLIASIFTTAGVLFVAIQTIGIIRNPLSAMIGLDQWAAVNTRLAQTKRQRAQHQQQ